MRIGKPPASEIRHRVRLAPNNIVQNPEIEILQQFANPENIVITANYPDRPIRFQHPARLGQPGCTKRIIGGKGIKLIPGISHRVDMALIRPRQITRQLQIMGGSANTRSTEWSANFFNSTMHSP